ncbi:hypothetical protein [Streptomyces sp. NPDC051546]|uniref:hypothetical protein n=1 Tax=Streptomyces sp. NPDC051546 TaxID=3365655 RepID=UPI00379FA956
MPPVHPLEGLREVGQLGLVQEALPLLRAADAGAALGISSDVAVVAYRTWGAYGAPKAAGDLMSAVLAVEEPGLRGWWADPVAMRTRMTAAAGPGGDAGSRGGGSAAAEAGGGGAAERPVHGAGPVGGGAVSGRYTARGLSGVEQRAGRGSGVREKGLYIRDIPPGLAARVPAGQRGPGGGGTSVRLLVSRGASEVSLHAFRKLPGLLRAGRGTR